MYWAPVVPNGTADVQGVAVMAFLWPFRDPTSRNTITWETVQWTTKFVFRDVILVSIIFVLLVLLNEFHWN